MRTTFNLTCVGAVHLKDAGDNGMPPSNILNVLSTLAMLEVCMGNCSNFMLFQFLAKHVNKRIQNETY